MKQCDVHNTAAFPNPSKELNLNITESVELTSILQEIRRMEKQVNMRTQTDKSGMRDTLSDNGPDFCNK